MKKRITVLIAYVLIFAMLASGCSNVTEIVSSDGDTESAVIDFEHVTRGQWAVLLTEKYSLCSVAEDRVWFQDVSQDSEFFHAVHVCCQAGIIEDSARYYYPDRPATMEFIAETTLRAVGETVPRKSIFSRGSKACEAAHELGLISSTDPNALITPEDAESILLAGSDYFLTHPFEEYSDIQLKDDLIDLSAQPVSSNDDSSIIFTDEIPRLRTGDVIIVNIDGTPLAKKVVSVSKEGDESTIIVEQPSVDEVYDSLDFAMHLVPQLDAIQFAENVEIVSYDTVNGPINYEPKAQYATVLSSRVGEQSKELSKKNDPSMGFGFFVEGKVRNRQVKLNVGFSANIGAADWQFGVGNHEAGAPLLEYLEETFKKYDDREEGELAQTEDMSVEGLKAAIVFRDFGVDLLSTSKDPSFDFITCRVRGNIDVSIETNLELGSIEIPIGSFPLMGSNDIAGIILQLSICIDGNGEATLKATINSDFAYGSYQGESKTISNASMNASFVVQGKYFGGLVLSGGIVLALFPSYDMITLRLGCEADTSLTAHFPINDPKVPKMICYDLCLSPVLELELNIFEDLINVFNMFSKQKTKTGNFTFDLAKCSEDGAPRYISTHYEAFLPGEPGSNLQVQSVDKCTWKEPSTTELKNNAADSADPEEESSPEKDDEMSGEVIESDSDAVFDNSYDTGSDYVLIIDEEDQNENEQTPPTSDPHLFDGCLGRWVNGFYFSTKGIYDDELNIQDINYDDVVFSFQRYRDFYAGSVHAKIDPETGIGQFDYSDQYGFSCIGTIELSLDSICIHFGEVKYSEEGLANSTIVFSRPGIPFENESSQWVFLDSNSKGWDALGFLCDRVRDNPEYFDVDARVDSRYPFCHAWGENGVCVDSYTLIINSNWLTPSLWIYADSSGVIFEQHFSYDSSAVGYTWVYSWDGTLLESDAPFSVGEYAAIYS